MKITPVKGTCDYLPNEALIRDYLKTQILKTYTAAGFEIIATPMLEDIENLDNSDGGDNLSLIFKILKRGEKLKKSIEENNIDELCDLGLRYDLTLPLSRYYANNRSKLNNPFKVIQMDKVFRAERPQRGRMREFMQCDIDTIGTTSISSEIELIDTAAKALLSIGIKNFKVKINDRRILKDILHFMRFNDDQIGNVSVIIDKLDKISVDGVENELIEKGYSIDSINELMEIFKSTPFTLEKAKKYCIDTSYVKNLQKIIESIEEISENKYAIEYDISLVRGQGYYTGAIFEIESLDFKGSIAGGGRYDNLIGKFLKEDIPAVGISIGFERIFNIFCENNFEIPDTKKKIAIVYDNDDTIVEAIKYANKIRDEYDVSLFIKPNKLGKLKEKLENQKFYGVYILGQSTEIEIFSKKEN